MAEPKIYTELLGATSIPSYGGTVAVKVIYEDYKSINNPIILFNGIRQTTNYMNDDSTMSNDLYNYKFDFPKTEEDRTINIIFQAIGEANEITSSTIVITQNGIGDNDEPLLTFDDNLVLSDYSNEYSYEESEDEYTLMAKVKTAIDEEVGELEVVTNVNWIRVDYKNGGDINHHYYKETVFNYTINIAENTNEESRFTTVTFNYYNVDNKLIESKDYMILQDGTLYSNNKEYRSVWEDIILEVDADTFNYKVIMCTLNNNDYTDNSNIFEGRAYKYPNADTIKIKMNKIFENYLSNSFVPMIEDVDVETIIKGDIDTYEYNFEAGKRFLIINRDTNEVVKEYVVLYDWNYKYKWRGEDVILSKPINRDNAINMVELKTTVNKLGVVTNYFNNENKINSCGDYCLYYLNSNGGWDVLLFNNKVKKTKNINSYTTERYFSRLNVDFEQMKYISELQNNYVFNTNFLTDEQAKNLVDNLFTSNEVYIHDLKENIIYSALITDNNVVYKKYSDDLNLVQYSINIKESQIQLKR